MKNAPVNTGRRSVKVYVAAPYTDLAPGRVEKNVKRAMLAAADLMRAGAVVFCPHWTHFLVPYLDEGLQFDHDFWMAQDLPWLDVCDGAVFLRGWSSSRGCMREFNYAQSTCGRIRIFRDVEECILWVRHEIASRRHTD